jgi:predicted  nucleic acid-binding Zn-ribbon protein
MADDARDRAAEARLILRDRDIAMHKGMADVLPWIDRMLAELQDLKAAHRADTKRLEAERDRVREQVLLLEATGTEAADEIDRLRKALHRISLGSQNSGTTKEDLGQDARTALGKDRT